LPPWTPLALIRWTTGYLAEKGLPEARLNAELLLADTLGLKRLDLYLQHDRPLQAEELARFKARLLRRARREPLQYIAGEAAFRELRLRVDRRVLIPRPETEVLVEYVLAWCRGRSGLSALDIGTGSGAIALSLATEGGCFDRIVATDVSADALVVACMNLHAAAPAVPVEFRQGAAFEPVVAERFEVIVSNPPYVAESDRSMLDPEVVEWEPEVALFSGAEGLTLIRQIVSAAPQHLSGGGLLALEIGAEQGEATRDLVLATAAFTRVDVKPDLSGRDRVVLAELA
jgi:release factor glutamine methyltransferase